MQRASGDLDVWFFTSLLPSHLALMSSDPQQFSSYRSPNDEVYRRPTGYSTRRLSSAIDSLRREGEAILWELNSLMTQNLTLEQRCKYRGRHVKLLPSLFLKWLLTSIYIFAVMGQTEELNRLCASLMSLRDQHRSMEQQYRESLQALRSELTAAQRGRQHTTPLPSHSTNRLPSQSAHERHHTPSPPRSLDHIDRRRSRQYSRPSTPSMTHNSYHRDTSSRIQSYAYSVDHNESELPPKPDITDSPSPYSMQQRSFTPPSLRPVSSFDPPSLSGSRHLTSPQGKSPDNAPSPPGTGHEPSVSPTATLIGSDGPGRSRHKKTRG